MTQFEGINTDRNYTESLLSEFKQQIGD